MTVTTEFVAQCVRPDQGPVPIRFTYDPAAPLEVVATFLDRPDVPWTFARDLLCEALDGAAGFGDVRAYTRGKTLTLQLRGSGDDGVLMTAVFAMPARKVAQFLARTAHLVPYGQERVDIDRELMALLGGTA